MQLFVQISLCHQVNYAEYLGGELGGDWVGLGSFVRQGVPESRNIIFSL